MAERKAVGTLLLVDDEPQICAAIRRIVHPDGYDILIANGAEEAMDCLAREPVDVIVSDERMPQKKGTEFLADVQRLYPGTVRMILSGAADVKEVAEAMEAGVIYKFLTKPTDPSLLRANIREAFSQAESLHAAAERPGGNLSERVAGLPDRNDLARSFGSLIASSTSHHETICLLMVKVDQYQDVIGSFGLAGARQFLHQVGQRLTGTLENDGYVAYDNLGDFLILTIAHDPFECINDIDERINRSFWGGR